MRIHPLPRKGNINIQYNMNSRTITEPLLIGRSHKILRRVPHIFNRVLQLPFRADADVVVEESAECFKFFARTDGIIGDVVRAHMLEIQPGVIRIVMKLNSFVGFSSLNDLELDVCWFRLSEMTRLELTSAMYEDGELIVAVPKGDEMEDLEEGGMGNGKNNMLVLV